MNNVEHFKKIATELGELYDKKNRCYGNSFSDTYKKLGIISAVTRISDKYNRLCNLATNPDIDNLGESLEDTLRDMASYCIMTVMELENAKPIGLDMKGNIIKRGDVVFPNLNKQIRKGDVFECIQHVTMDDGRVVYVKGKAYASEKEDCITDETHDDNHYWNVQEYDEDNWELVPDIKREFKVGDRVRNKNYKDYIYDIYDITDRGYRAKEINADSPILILFGSQEANYELVPNKFDISTLKPFDKVLVRDNDKQEWVISFFSHCNGLEFYKYSCINGCGCAYCIPYEGNEHLLGTTNDCDDFYKTWKK